ncbi:MAG: hypothetical protein L0216_06325 [Planctomycetales bacterium]|nr:hypothetical protein [Planctomycetales bacterium]
MLPHEPADDPETVPEGTGPAGPAPEPADAGPACRRCAAPIAPDEAFCRKCGKKVPGVAPGRPRAGRLARKSREKSYLSNIQTARYIMLAIAALQLLVAIGFALWAVQAGRGGPTGFEEGLEDPELLAAGVDPRRVVQVAMLVVAGATAFMGLVFLGTFFWAKRSPFAATVTALVVYLTLTVASAFLMPCSLLNPLTWGIIIFLVIGLRSAAGWRRMQAEEAAA